LSETGDSSIFAGGVVGRLHISWLRVDRVPLAINNTANDNKQNYGSIQSIFLTNPVFLTVVISAAVCILKKLMGECS